MLRVVLINIALFVLPLALYAAYFYARERNQNAVAIEWKNMPLSFLLQAGLGLIVIGMLVTAYSIIAHFSMTRFPFQSGWASMSWLLAWRVLSGMAPMDLPCIRPVSTIAKIWSGIHGPS